MKKKFMSLTIVAMAMIVGVMVVSAATPRSFNVNANTHFTNYYNNTKSNMVSMITSEGGNNLPTYTFIRYSAKFNNAYSQTNAFAQEVLRAGNVSIENKYSGTGTIKLELFGTNQNTHVAYSTWTGEWSYYGS